MTQTRQNQNDSHHYNVLYTSHLRLLFPKSFDTPTTILSAYSTLYPHSHNTKSGNTATPTQVQVHSVWFRHSLRPLGEIGAFFKKSGKNIISLTVQDLLDGDFSQKLA
jgi:hypothetical protein